MIVLSRNDADSGLRIFNSIAAMGLPTPTLPVNLNNVTRKYFIYGERELQAYRARVQAIANIVARLAAEDAT